MPPADPLYTEPGELDARRRGFWSRRHPHEDAPAASGRPPSASFIGGLAAALLVPALGSALLLWREAHAQTVLLVEMREEAKALRREIGDLTVLAAQARSEQAALRRDVEKLDGRVTAIEAQQLRAIGTGRPRPP